MQLFGAAAHGSVILFDKEPTDFILGEFSLLVAGGRIRGSRRLSGLEAGIVDSGVSGGIIRVGVCRVVAVNRDLRSIGHGG